jgi:hypothetical protein
MEKKEKALLKLSQFGFLALIIWFVAGTTISSCQKTQNNGDTLSTTSQTTTQNNPPQATPAVYVTEYPVYKTTTESELARNRDTIASIRERLQNVNAKLRASISREEDALAQENAALQARLEAYKDQGTQSWQQFKADFDRSMDSMRLALQNVQTKIYIKNEE